MPTAPNISMTTSRCAQSRRPKSLSRVRRRTNGLIGQSVRAMALMTILVTASAPTLGCFASCCTSLSDAIPIFTSTPPVVEVRSMSAGKSFARFMLMSRPDSTGASCATDVWQRSTTHKKTFRSAPTGLVSACTMALQMPANASSGPAPPRLAASECAHTALPSVRSATMTAFSSPLLGRRKARRISVLQPAHRARFSGTSQADSGAVMLRPSLPVPPKDGCSSSGFSSCSGSFSKRRTCTKDFGGVSLGSAATHASRPGFCASSSPTHFKCILQTSV
mmetsp:Transcript_103335/g.322028  ORF Transcript_103335/g.322028 Transcript_103335/m.322028 type:complete len:278 (-) Transcript_103335:61-894(-)